MINRAIFKELTPITDEEQDILGGRSTVDSSLYTENDSNPPEKNGVRIILVTLSS